jgi:putative protein-disulfide isomerase
LAENYPSLQVEVLSGGMILAEKPVPIAATAGYIQKAYPTVEELTGIKFGADYLWHINNPDLSDWFPHSEKPAIALCIFKEYYPERQVEFAATCNTLYILKEGILQMMKPTAISLEKYSIQPEVFYTKLKSEEYKEQAYYEFQLCKQLQVTGYPCVLLQHSETKFTLLARGFTDYETLSARLNAALKEME